MNEQQLRERAEHIADARRNGTASLGQLAKQYGITRERVRQIAEQMGVDSAEAARKYQRTRADRKFDAANEHAAAILMRFIAGENASDMARDLGLPTPAVQEVLDEQVTDAVLAARSNRRMAMLHPEIDAGPREDWEGRVDRVWTPERCWEALMLLAREHGGILPNSNQYKKIAPTRDDLPSFPTVRNRLGRWTSVRAEVHRRLR